MRFLAVACLLAVLWCQAQAQSLITIPASARIYVDSASGFDAPLAAAMKNQGLSFAITTKKDEADYELEAMSGARRLPGAAWSVLWGHGDAQAAIRLVNIRSGEIAFVYTLARSKIVRDPLTTAEACAKQLKFGMNPAAIPPTERLESKNSALDF
jgi:hypothetical protein